MGSGIPLMVLFPHLLGVLGTMGWGLSPVSPGW